MRNFRLIPFVIIVVALAFSLRLVEIAGGISMLSGMAAYAKNGESDKTKAAHEEALSEERESSGEGGSEEGASHEKEGEQTADSGDEEPPSVDWRDAGDADMEYSAVKMEVLEDLAARHRELEAEEERLIAREAVLKAAEQELDRKYQELLHLREEIKGLLEQQSEEELARIVRLVKVYEGMKPKDAARIFDTLDLDILVSVMSRMSERKLSPILAAMNPERARTVTIMLAEQKKLPVLPKAQPKP